VKYFRKDIIKVQVVGYLYIHRPLHGKMKIKKRNDVLIKPSLHNTYDNSRNYYNYLTKQQVSALFGHHRAYKTVVLVKVHSVAFTYGTPWFTVVLSIFFELQVLFKSNYHTIKSDII